MLLIGEVTEIEFYIRTWFLVIRESNKLYAIRAVAYWAAFPKASA
jgi:hypothetical protein